MFQENIYLQENHKHCYIYRKDFRYLHTQKVDFYFCAIKCDAKVSGYKENTSHSFLGL